jgi:alkanesulfonate monooxygenase SsuD/methylene tetrahydromethanopterin reductase-like flavin-dependent oxidoreductase (luciferase family)
MSEEAPLALDRFRLGVQVLSYGAAWPEVAEVVQLADTLGYDYVFGADHLWATGGDPLLSTFEGWTTLAAWAAVVRHASVGLLVTANSFRNPGLVAKMVTTVDHISNGRAVLGLGAGWWAGEQRAHGIDVGSGLAERLRWMDEAAGIIRGLLRGEQVSADGHYHFDHVRHNPRPIGPVPILIGATGERGMEIAGRWADLWHAWIGPNDVAGFRALSANLDAACVRAGRDPRAVIRVPGCKMVLRSDPAEAQRIFERLLKKHQWPEEVRQHAWLGTAEWAVGRVNALAEAGAGGLVIQLASPYDLETVQALPAALRPTGARPSAPGRR